MRPKSEPYSRECAQGQWKARRSGSDARPRKARRIGRDARARERVPLGRLHTARYDSPPAHSLCRASRPILLHTQPPLQDTRGSAQRTPRRHAAHSRESDTELRGGGGWVVLTRPNQAATRPPGLTTSAAARPLLRAAAQLRLQQVAESPKPLLGGLLAVLLHGLPLFVE